MGAGSKHIELAHCIAWHTHSPIAQLVYDPPGHAVLQAISPRALFWSGHGVVVGDGVIVDEETVLVDTVGVGFCWMVIGFDG